MTNEGSSEKLRRGKGHMRHELSKSASVGVKQLSEAKQAQQYRMKIVKQNGENQGELRAPAVSGGRGALGGPSSAIRTSDTMTSGQVPLL